MMSKPEQRHLEPEQAAAAYEINKHISVTAGPGSGKTTVLVERYLHILRDRELSIDQIVAITFTNRAANEMRERLRSQLNQILQTASGKQRRRWLDYKRTLDGAVITTIHGFCARLLREFPVEARVDPQFLLLDEHRAAMLLEAVVEETLSEFISSGHPEISRLTLGVGRARLAAALAQLYWEVRGQGLSLEDLALNTAKTHATELDHANALIEMDQAIDELLRIRRTTAAQRANHSQVVSAWGDLHQVLHSIPDADNLADYCRAVESFRVVRPTARGDIQGQVKRLDSLVWDKNLSGRVPQVCLDLFASQFALEMVNLLSRIDARLNEEKQKLSALDFDDLEFRALALLERPEVLTRTAERYKFFLVDEFQDTNGLQRQLLERLALPESSRRSANLFIVGDRKQSIYGFRGADVDVFREMTESLVENGGEIRPLALNFRSQPQLVGFFNHLFQKLFEPSSEIPVEALEELGYVEHEPSTAKRDLSDNPPLVELLITTTASTDESDPKSEQTSRELDARQLAIRIKSLVDENKVTKYSEIALLFRAMTHASIYEQALRHANIPYQTVLGRGFYERPEITDLIQLLRFLDNKTDELALAAVLRSPLCGISDNALLALRCAPWLKDVDATNQMEYFNQTRKLVYALNRNREIAFISDEEHGLLDRSAHLIEALIARRHHYSIRELLRFAVEQSEYMTVIAANFDGPQRLVNVQRLFTLAERFEQSGAHLIRDFVRYVEEFEAIGSRESEGQIDEAANVVRLMTIHQAKGLEFPVVILPDLQRSSRPLESWVLLDRHKGLTLKVPDGRGKLVAGCSFNNFEQRQAWREQFESMRLLYVAATRAQDGLIFSGTTPELDKLTGKPDTWLKWIWQSLGLEDQKQSGVIPLTDDVEIQLTVNLSDQGISAVDVDREQPETLPVDDAASLESVFPLVRSIEPQRLQAIHRFSVTQLINYQRCPRQYYFDRVLHVPSAEEIAVWNDAEAPEPPANLTATLKGAVIHRFCEIYAAGEDARERVRSSLDEIIGQRQAELADRLVEIDREAAVKDLLPLAENYVSSSLFRRVEAVRAGSGVGLSNKPLGKPGLWSELSFRLRRPLGVLSGSIDKLLVSGNIDSGDLDIEIIDFKTNKLGTAKGDKSGGIRAHAGSQPKSRSPRVVSSQQIALDFMEVDVATVGLMECDDEVSDPILVAARDYQLQMQAYALAVRVLMPSFSESARKINVTLHFLEPNVEYRLPKELLEEEVCAQAIDDAMLQIASSLEPGDFPVRPEIHCRMCNFLGVCSAGQEWLRL